MTTLIPTRGTALLETQGTYTPSASDEFTYGVSKTGDGTTTIARNLKVKYPTEADSTKARPAIIGFGGGGFSFTAGKNAIDAMDPFISMGAVSFACDYSTILDATFNDANVGGDTDRTKAIRSAIHDIRRAVDWVLTHRALGGFQIDERGVVLLGDSAGAQLCMLHAMRANHGVAAVINIRGGLGLDNLGATSGPSDTADLRAFGTEANITLGDPPVVAFLGGADTVVGVPHINALKARLELHADNAVYYEAAEGHTAIDAFPHVDPGGGLVSPYEAVRQFLNNLWSTQNARPSKITIA